MEELLTIRSSIRSPDSISVWSSKKDENRGTSENFNLLLFLIMPKPEKKKKSKWTCGLIRIGSFLTGRVRFGFKIQNPSTRSGPSCYVLYAYGLVPSNLSPARPVPSPNRHQYLWNVYSTGFLSLVAADSSFVVW